MDEFIHDMLNKKSRTIGVENFIEAYKKFPVLASDDYLVNELARTQKDIILINPKSAIGKFLKEQIPKVDELLKIDLPKQEDKFAYNFYQNNESVDEVQNKEESQSVEQPRKESIFVADDYRDTTIPIQRTNQVYQIPQFDSSQSWYNQNPNRSYLENILQKNSANNFASQNQYGSKRYYSRYRRVA